MRILFTVDQPYLPQRTGGAIEGTHALCEALTARDHKVAVLSEIMPHGFLGFANRLKRRLGVHAPSDHSNGYLVYRDWEPVERVPAVCHAFRPEVAIVKSGKDPQMAEAFAAAGIPLIMYLRDMEFDRDEWQRPVGRALCFLANSTAVADRFEARFGVRPWVIHSLITAERYRVDSSRETVTFINPVPVKGLEVALALAARRPDIPFEFVEAWPMDANQYESLNLRLRSSTNITLRRWTRDMRAIYARTRVLIVPSQWEEAQARIVAEAQLSGIPVIASNVGGLPESVGPGGILVDRADTDAWERALSELWDQPQVYAELSERAIGHSKRPEIQPEHIVSRLLELLRDHVERVGVTR